MLNGPQGHVSNITVDSTKLLLENMRTLQSNVKEHDHDYSVNSGNFMTLDTEHFHAYYSCKERRLINVTVRYDFR